MIICGKLITFFLLCMVKTGRAKSCNPISCKSCDIPGPLHLYCSNGVLRSLELPNAGGNFTVEHINPDTRTIELRDDSGKCFPEKLMKLNLTHTPFHAREVKNYTLYNCSVHDDFPYFNDWVTCLSNSNYSIVSVSDGSSNYDYSTSQYCRHIEDVMVPIPKGWCNLYADWRLDHIRSIELSWDKPDCSSCVIGTALAIIITLLYKRLAHRNQATANGVAGQNEGGSSTAATTNTWSLRTMIVRFLSPSQKPEGQKRPSIMP